MAAPPILTLADIGLTFGGDPLLAGVTLAVQPGERIALVGRNGSGKSTLMKLMAGLVEPDSGTRFVQPGLAVGYMAQDPQFEGFASLGAFAGQALPPGEEWRVAAAMEGLSLDAELDPARASGGERRRAALAKILAEAPDLMLLDEPTNHLDIAAIGWLEAHLAATRTAFVTVSHDRAFLRHLTDRMLWVDRGEVRRLDRGFAAFEEWRDKLFEDEDAARHKLDRLIKSEGRWAVEGISARRRRNQGRVRRLADLRAERRDAIARAGTAKLEFEAGPLSGKLVIEAVGDRQVLRRAADPAGLLAADRARRAGGAGRSQRGGQDDASEPADRRAGPRRRAGAAGREPRAGGVRPEPRGARPRREPLGDADRRSAGRQRPGDGARAAAACGGLPQGVPVRRGAGARAGLGAVGRRAGAAAAGAADGAGVRTSWCSTSRPTTSTSRRSTCSRSWSRTTTARCCWSATTATSSTGPRPRRSRWRATGGRSSTPVAGATTAPSAGQTRRRRRRARRRSGRRRRGRRPRPGRG